MIAGGLSPRGPPRSSAIGNNHKSIIRRTNSNGNDNEEHPFPLPPPPCSPSLINDFKSPGEGGGAAASASGNNNNNNKKTPNLFSKAAKRLSSETKKMVKDPKKTISKILDKI